MVFFSFFFGLLLQYFLLVSNFNSIFDSISLFIITSLYDCFISSFLRKFLLFTTGSTPVETVLIGLNSSSLDSLLRYGQLYRKLSIDLAFFYICLRCDYPCCNSCNAMLHYSSYSVYYHHYYSCSIYYYMRPVYYYY